MNILFTICGRAGSKGIPGKNVKDFLGIPLPLYTISAIDLYLKANPDIKYNIVLNTDSDKLNDLFKNQKLRPYQLVERKQNLAGDNVSKVDVIKDCLIETENSSYDMIVDLDITSPLRTSQNISDLVNTKSATDYDVVFSVTEARRNPYFNMVKKTQGSYERVIKSNFVSRQQAPEIFDMNASMYAYSPAFLKSGKNIFDGKCGIISMMDTGILDLDKTGDFALMEVIAAYLYDNYPEFNAVKQNISKH